MTWVEPVYSICYGNPLAWVFWLLLYPWSKRYKTMKQRRDSSAIICTGVYGTKIEALRGL